MFASDVSINIMTARTTIRAKPDDLLALKGEARRRGLSMAAFMETILAEQARVIRSRVRPRLALARSGHRTGSMETVRDEESPAKNTFRS